LGLDVIEEGVEGALDHGAEAFALAVEVELVDLGVEHGADDPAPLVGAEDAVTGVLELGEVGADEASGSETVDGEVGEPDGGDEEDDGSGEAQMVEAGGLALEGIRRCGEGFHGGDNEYRTGGEARRIPFWGDRFEGVGGG
jgi:hypothetical protein